MKILLDIDGVICTYQFSKIVKNFFGVDLTEQMLFAYDLADVLGVAPALINKMFHEQVYGEAQFIDGALDVLNGWRERGYELVLFTNRIKYMSFYNLLNWLRNNKIPFDNMDLLGDGMNYDYHIDDSPAKLMSTNSKVKLLFNQPWNKRCLDITKSLTRVKSWDEIKGIVK